MNFTKTSPKFGQWSDHRANTVYGLGFSAEKDLVQVSGRFLSEHFILSLQPNFSVCGEIF